MTKLTREDALRYHEGGRPGKLEVIPTKPHSTQRDLSLAYSPGVAHPCLEIESTPDDIYRYTSKGNLVAVISNGTAVLGLGDIGAGASKPVMEGKGLLFKIFADIDVFDVEVDTHDPGSFVQTVKNIAVTFGGINLEDIKAPECFEIEEKLKQALQIPVMHDDQHGTAIICSAGVINALELAGKTLADSRIVINGAGAAAIACAKLLVSLGAIHKNMVMLDSKGALRKDRTDLNKYKFEFATDRNIHTLTEAMQGADIFLGLSKANCVTVEMIRSMAPTPIVFAMANPDPEIAYDLAMTACDDIIMATGRSDYPNQVNNVLGFPYIFRGALDVRATCINEQMKIAAVHALARLAKEPVPESVSKAYNINTLIFGKDYIIPKPLDPRLITRVAPAVAQAAIESGVARLNITDWENYRLTLSQRMGLESRLLHSIILKAKQSPKRIVFPEGNNVKVLRAANDLLREEVATPILLGDVAEIEQLITQNHLDLSGVAIYDPRCYGCEEKRRLFADMIWTMRCRKGITYEEAYDLTFNRNYYGVMMVETGMADAMISGVTSHYGDVISPALRIIGPKPKLNHISSMSVIITKKRPLFFADTTVNLDPDVQTLVETTLLAAEEVRKFNVEPVIAMVSYSNFGSVKESEKTKILIKVRQAIKILHHEHPELIVDGEIQMDFALNKELRSRKFPFTRLEGLDVNTIIFPNLTSGNIAHKLMYEIGGCEVIGPILMGMQKPVHVVPTECSVREIFNMAAIAVLDAQTQNQASSAKTPDEKVQKQH